MPYGHRTDAVQMPYGHLVRAYGGCTARMPYGYRTDMSYNWLKHIPILLGRHGGCSYGYSIQRGSAHTGRDARISCSYLYRAVIVTDIVRISYRYRNGYRTGYRTDVRRTYGGCTAKYRTDIVQAPYGYRTDITEPLPLKQKGRATWSVSEAETHLSALCGPN